MHLESLMRMYSAIVTLFVCVLLGSPSQAEDAADWAAWVGESYRITTDLVYSTANGYENKLDLYLPREKSDPRPTLVYIHGGGWVSGAKESSVLRLLPYLRLGMNVVNVEYRLARYSLAPAAVADCRCALRWVIANAEEHGFDTDRIVVTGHSAGGHLSLMTGILNEAAGFDYECVTGSLAGSVELDLKVAAVVNWFGITDVGDLLEGENQQGYAVRWMGSLAERLEIAERVSPLTYVREDLPPILTIHGDADKIVPYQHAVRLHEALDGAGAPNRLHTVEGGKHGGFSKEQMVLIHGRINVFLKEHGVL